MILLAGRGPAPKDASTRRRRNKEPEPVAFISVDDVVRGPDLPDASVAFPDGGEWHPMTRRWWDVWRRSPMAQRIIDVEWETMLLTAMIHNKAWSEGRVGAAQEIRLRESNSGATQTDRKRLGIAELEPSDARSGATGTDGKVTDIAARRARLSEG